MTIKLNGSESTFLTFLVNNPALISYKTNYRLEVQEFAEKIISKHKDALGWIEACESAFPNGNGLLGKGFRTQ